MKISGGHVCFSTKNGIDSFLSFSLVMFVVFLLAPSSSEASCGNIECRRGFMGYTFAVGNELALHGDESAYVNSLELSKPTKISHGLHFGFNIPFIDYFTLDLVFMDMLFWKNEIEDKEELSFIIDILIRPIGRIPFGDDDRGEVYLALPIGVPIMGLHSSYDESSNESDTSVGFAVGTALGMHIYVGDDTGLSFYAEASWLFRIYKFERDISDVNDEEANLIVTRGRFHQAVFSFGFAFPTHG